MKDKDKRIIGIIGGIGSGKTMVLNLLRENYGADIIEADKIGHELQAPNEVIYRNIINEFGTDILEEPAIVGKSAIDRRKLGAIVFNDDKKLQRLNNISHPAIHKRICDMLKASDKKLIFIEAAILTETTLINLVDEIWYIYADTKVRLDRLQKYRNISHERATQIMTNQPDDKHFREKCNAVIDNSGTSDNTFQQIKRIIDNYI